MLSLTSSRRVRDRRRKRRGEAANERNVKLLITAEMRTKRRGGKAAREERAEMHTLPQMRAK